MISRAIEAKGWTNGAELGVLAGKTLLYLLARHQNLHMVAVDTWQPRPEMNDQVAEGGRSYDDIDLEKCFDYVQRQIGKHEGWTERCHVMRMSTAEAAAIVEACSLDFVFIDADHTYEGVKEDILRWASKIREGGALMGHDANHERFPGVTQALDELLPGWEFGDDRTWMIPIEKVHMSIRRGLHVDGMDLPRVDAEQYMKDQGL